jgi:dienelactone hydrolase
MPKTDDRSSTRTVDRRVELECCRIRVTRQRFQHLHSNESVARGPADAAYISSFIAQRTSGAVVLVGHSCGGFGSTNAVAHGSAIKALGCVNAFIPAAWKSLPSWAVLGTEDRVVPPDVQRTMAQARQRHHQRDSRLTRVDHFEPATTNDRRGTRRDCLR